MIINIKPPMKKENEELGSNNFISNIIENDLKNGKINKVITRFPPEPNGYLHLGHAKSIFLNFGLAKKFNGQCNLRFDDTNPSAENEEYIESIISDMKWLGCDWGENLFYTSHYFSQLYEYAETLIRNNLAYVDHQSEEEVRINRGSITQPGIDSIYRNRTIDENLKLFRQMKEGVFKDGECILRAKIDMKHSNMNMRDPPIYRIKHETHPITGDTWCIYPIYDFAHGQSDSIEGITHSICTLEFFDHKMLYNWFQDKLNIKKVQQIEFARLNLTYTVMSKRKLLCLVEEGIVDGWDDPRLPTIRACRRRGIPAKAIENFVLSVGVARRQILSDIKKFENCIRQTLKDLPRRLVVLDPLLVTIENWPEDNYIEEIEVNNYSTDIEKTRKLYMSKQIYIESSDFSQNPPKNWKRLIVGGEVRLKNSYIIKCNEVIVNSNNNPIQLICSIDESSANGQIPNDSRKCKSTIHWVSLSKSQDITLYLYDYLFTIPDLNNLTETDKWENYINTNSKKIINAKGEANLVSCSCKDQFQFERVGYFICDNICNNKYTFIRTITLVDEYAAKSNLNAQLAQEKEMAKAARIKANELRNKKKKLENSN